jgi:hypothetical protein
VLLPVKKKYWEYDDFEIGGFPPDTIEDKQYSLENVIQNLSRKKNDVWKLINCG